MIIQELGDLKNNPCEGVSIEIVGDVLTQWVATVIGPVSHYILRLSRQLIFIQDDTPYAGGNFQISIDFSDNYPFKAPKVFFKTKIYHPNIKQDTGEICAQAIENNWVPTLNAKYVIESLVTLLKNPNADNPLEADIADLFSKDYATFAAKAQEFTASYAK